ncbi:MAG: CarD family transcriptional regulator [Aeriscardovia sp.]|nr:CarD family transcriptional regulator [Aeriscardovia sp.]MBO6019518.1 CarD family transcriptional regulator [Aeriscardovia sp.]MBO6072010.1 CarD family transcriptional regulator [Aeriscardovia sp.]MBO7717514.1 CarD family transcriptional regulator [Aeriscardovia sp.]MBQ1419517.1 CarD family transcriptional regulator [Aeriscardovia sp.]
MSYNEGDIVVYPRHGCCKVIGTENRNDTVYIKLETISELNNDLTIMIPVKNLDMIGVRDVISPEKADEILELFKTEKAEEKKMNWSKRFKANQEKIYSGDLEQIAEVVRDLSRKDADMANGEKKILSQAKDILYTEIAISKNMDKAEIAEMFEKELEEPEAKREDGQD